LQATSVLGGNGLLWRWLGNSSSNLHYFAIRAKDAQKGRLKAIDLYQSRLQAENSLFRSMME
jgi:hypothetical protein